MDELSYAKNKLKIVLLENIHPKAVKVFHDNGFTRLEHSTSALSHSELIQCLHDAHILGIRSGTHVTQEVLAHCTKLMAIGCFCIGTNQVDLQNSMLKGIPVFNDPHSNTRSVAEMVIGLCIVLMRNLFNKNAAAHAGQWKKHSSGAHELRGKSLGIVGYGRIGTQVAILAEAMGMQVFYYDIEQKLSLGNVKSMPSLQALLSMADIVTLHVPETPATRNLINAENLPFLKKSAYLINTSRGKVVDIEALAQALRHKVLQGAAIDVFQQEPADVHKPFSSVLQNMENVILTPHIGGATEEAQESIALSVSQKLVHFINRGSTEGATNFPAICLAPNENTHRILHVHHNIPGILYQINKILSDQNINILVQYLKTNQEVGYVVFDLEKKHDDHLLASLKAIQGTIRARILY